VASLESLIGLLLAAVVLAAIARRVGAPYPAFLALGGAVLAFVPGVPIFHIEPDLALALFVAPVLLDAAYDASPRDLKDNWAPLIGLVVVAVIVTTAVVAGVARLLVPAMPWAAAIALGAVVAPPDAAAAIAVLRQVRPPHRLLTILEGESLLNDATALMIYRLAVGAALTNAFSIRDVAPTFAVAVIGSIVVGPALAWLFLRLTRNVEDVPSAIVLQFVGTFGVWMLAEHLGLSAVLTMVCFAIAVARRAPELTPARLRIPSYAVWDTVVFVMNVLAFVLIGLQIRPILASLQPAIRTQYFTVAAAVLATVILVRIGWVFAYVAVVKFKNRVFGFRPARPMLPPTYRGAAIVSWCGMRGIVTLAAALALPTAFDRGPSEFRDLIILTAFSVVLGTLVIQGLTLKAVVRVVDLRDDDPVGREVGLARERALRAALASVEGDESPAAEAVRQEYSRHLKSARDGRVDRALARSADAKVRRQALAAARSAVLGLRDTDEIGDDAFHRIEEELDRLELGLEES
jgi:CPA1 family monovalent cation:H+ antiporter